MCSPQGKTTYGLYEITAMNEVNGRATLQRKMMTANRVVEEYVQPGNQMRKGRTRQQEYELKLLPSRMYTSYTFVKVDEDDDKVERIEIDGVMKEDVSEEERRKEDEE